MEGVCFWHYTNMTKFFKNMVRLSEILLVADFRTVNTIQQLFLSAIFREGGVRINIVPEKAVLEICVRAPTDMERMELEQRLLNCAKAAALSTGCSVSLV